MAKASNQPGESNITCLLSAKEGKESFSGDDQNKGHDQLEEPRRRDWSKSWVEGDKEECGKGDAFSAAETSAIPARKLFGPGQELHMTDRMRYELKGQSGGGGE